jgi:hypothetical protein
MSDLKMNMSYEVVAKASAEFHLAYGMALSQWALVEAVLYDWFHLTTGMNDKMARSVFYSAKSFAGRAEMLEAALGESTHSTEILDFAKAVIKKARTYSTFRNEITHGEMLLNLKSGDNSSAHYTLVQGKNIHTGGITIDELKIATTNFKTLRELALDMLPIYRGEYVQSPAEHLAQVRALPSQANSKDAHIQPTPEKQPQSQHRDKKAHRASQRTAKGLPPDGSE